MRNKTALLAGLCGAAIAAGAAVGEGIDKQDFKQIERGRYLTVAGDCAACHTLPGSGHEFAGGRNIETPFGLLIGPNITPDPQTGIGAWTDDEFVNALKNGTGRDGERLYPAMPYTYYTKITREDALAIRAYLNTLPPVYNPVQPNQLLFPFDTSAHRCWCGTSCSSRWGRFGQIQTRARNGIGARIWPRVSPIAACATRRRMRLAATITPMLYTAMLCKDGSRLTLPATRAAASGAGRSRRS
jgi:hypothetical protein